MKCKKCGMEIVAGVSKKRGVCLVCHEKEKALNQIFPERLKGANDYSDHWEKLEETRFYNILL